MSKSNNQNIRKQLFDVYSLNLALIKESKVVSIEPDIVDTILCPICQQLFEREHLNTPQGFTLDHVPPESLGGKDRDCILLCGDCNHNLGTKVDAHLGKTLKARDFAIGSLGSSLEAKLSFNNLPAIDVTLSRNNDETLMIAIDHSRVNPEYSSQLITEFELMQESSQFVGNLSFRGGKQQQTEIATLRIAYLMFFRLFGYGAILSKEYEQVRNQIVNIEQQLLPVSWNLPRAWAANMELGISLITHPNELRAFVTVFDLIRPTGSSRHAVLLPTLDSVGSTLYQRINQLRGTRFDSELQGKLIEPNLAFWTDPKQIFAATMISQSS